MFMKFRLQELEKLIPDWQRLAGESGYQHNGQHLGKHTQEVIDNVKADRQFLKLPGEYQEALTLAAFFHDMGKPTGKLGETVPRVINHEEKSVKIAGSELKRLGYPSETIRRVRLLIKHDNLMSEYGRKKLHGEKYSGVLPPAISKRFNYDKFLLTALLILNKADVIAAGRGSGKPGRWGKIRPWVNEYFLKCIKEAK